MNLIEWLNGITKLNKTTMDEFQNNIQEGIDQVQENLDDKVEIINTTIGNIISVTTNTNGKAVKFSNGIMICYKTISLSNQAVNTASGSMYVSGEISLGNFAENFNNVPVVSVNLTGSNYSGIVNYVNNISTSSAGTLQILRPTSTTAGRYTVNVIAIGTYATE